MMTEAEAKTKWCPLARAPDVRGNSDRCAINRNGNDADVDCYCLGSSCMMWRWAGDSPPFPGAGPEDSLNHLQRQGYCGQGGKP